MVPRLSLIWLSVISTAAAQIAQLVTSRDGSIVYFSSAMKLLGDSSEVNWPKIFGYQHETGKIELAFQITSYSRVDAWGGTTPYILEFPDVSSDGRTLVYTARGGYCGAPGSTCNVYVGSTAYKVRDLRQAGGFLGNSARLSRNAKYALAFPYNDGFASVAAITTFWGVSDPPLVLGRWLIPRSDGYQAISDVGSVLIGNSLFDFQGYDPAQSSLPVTILNMSQTPVVGRLSADGKRIVYEAYITDRPVLILYDVESARESVLVRGTVAPQPLLPATILHPWINDDASMVLYIDSPAPGLPPQIFLMPSERSAAASQLSAEPEGISIAVLSGDGDVVYAATMTNRILRIQTASRAVHEISGANILVSGDGAPGSFMRLTSAAFPAGLQPGSVKIGGVSVPVLNASSTTLDIQIPWEFELPDLNGSPFPMTFAGQSASAFAPPSISVSYVSPAFLRLSAPTVVGDLSVIAHQDFHGVVSPTDPAKPGEILHFYMTGLGPVSPAIETGLVTPSDTLYRVSGPPECKFYYYDDYISQTVVPAQLLFAGLAPGMTGIYQVDVRVPARLGRDPSFGCVGYLPAKTRGDVVRLPVAP